MNTASLHGWVDSKTFTRAIEVLPLISIDLCLVSEGCLLLGRRNNRPAKGSWFTPGGRILKGENIRSAISRISINELSFDLLQDSMTELSLMGAWDHCYEDSAYNINVSTHYINLPHYCILNATSRKKFKLPEGSTHQHAEWRWQPLKAVAQDQTVHAYVRDYAFWLVDVI